MLRDRWLDAAMHRDRVTRDELLAAVGVSGHSGVEGLHAVVLATGGTLSVVGFGDEADHTAAAGMRGSSDDGPKAGD